MLLAATSAAAETEIHRCLLQDGTVAFQEKPCAEPVADIVDASPAKDSRGAGERHVADNDPFDFVNPFDETADHPPAAEQTLPEPVSRNRAECENKTRDSIDAIDLEMRKKAYTKEQGQEYLAELLKLTRQLRGCRAL